METKPIVVVSAFKGGQFGGSYISAVTLITRSVRNRTKPVFLLHCEKGDFCRYLNDRNFSYITMNDVGVLMPGHTNSVGRVVSAATKYPLAIFKLLHLLRQHKIEIVHTNSGLIYTKWELPAVLSGAKILWHPAAIRRPNGCSSGP